MSKTHRFSLPSFPRSNQIPIGNKRTQLPPNNSGGVLNADSLFVQISRLPLTKI